MNRNRPVVVVTCSFFIGSAAMAQSDAAAPDAVLEAWASAFNECSAEKVAALYDPSATLWGTNATALIGAPEGVRFYFNRACAMQPPVKVDFGERTTRVFGATAAIAGTYTFVRDGRNIPARFSYTLVRADGRWLIVQHHSSLLPGYP